MNPLIEKMIRAAKLDIRLYEEVEADKSALFESMMVVVMASVAGGIGMIWKAGITGLITGTFTALVGWLIWSYVTYIVGTKLLPTPTTKADYGELLRTIGFSSSPGVIRVIGIIPGLSGIVFFAAGIWMLVTMVVAVRQALDYTSTLRAVGVCIIGWIIQAVVLGIFFSMFR
ncbi:MAG: hypothetical protein PVG39_30900 [Desulfobacteraceae bacterium]|jgi:hypothetical protein